MIIRYVRLGDRPAIEHRVAAVNYTLDRYHPGGDVFISSDRPKNRLAIKYWLPGADEEDRLAGYLRAKRLWDAMSLLTDRYGLEISLPWRKS